MADPDSIPPADNSSVPVTPEEVEQPPQNLPPNFSPVPPKHSRFLKAYAFIIAILVVGGAAFAIVNHFSNSNDQPAKIVTKKDIPLIRYGLTTGPINTFYPDIQDSNI